MRRLYVVRHAVSVEPSDHSQAEEWSPLTPKGRHRFRRVAKTMSRLKHRVQVICTSPLLRAAQTAEILAGALGCDDVRVVEELRPGNGAAALLKRLAREAAGAKGLVLVGHDPQLSELLGSLTHLNKREQDQLQLKKGAIVRLDVSDLRKVEEAEPRWWLEPRSRSLVEGLPMRAVDEAAEDEKKPAKQVGGGKKSGKVSRRAEPGKATIERPRRKQAGTKHRQGPVRETPRAKPFTAKRVAARPAPKPPAAAQPARPSKPAASKPRPAPRKAPRAAAAPTPKPAAEAQPPPSPAEAQPQPPPVIQTFMGSPRPLVREPPKGPDSDPTS